MVQSPWQRIAVAFIVLHLVLLTTIALRSGITRDEVANVPSGISHWKSGRFDLARVNPPLARMVASLPVVLFADPTTDWSHYPQYETDRNEFLVAQDFIIAHGKASSRYYLMGRLACIPFMAIGAWICWRWAADLYGESSGLLALFLWTFSPTVICNGSLATSDGMATSIGLLANYMFWKWCRLSRPTWFVTIATGVVLGTALLTKGTWLILLILWPALSVSLMTRQMLRSGLQLPVKLILILAVGVSVLNLGYFFEGTFRKLGDYSFSSHLLGGANASPLTPQNQFRGTLLGSVPVPLPKNYVQGFDRIKFELERGYPSYLRGEWRDEGWWWYYAYALCVKLPDGTCFLIGVSVLCRIAGRQKSVHAADAALLCSPAVTILLLASAQTGFNHHVRYIMPVLPTLFIWTSGVMRYANSRGKRHSNTPEVLEKLWSLGIAGCIVWTATSSLWIYPHSHSYFNAMSGGPRNGHQHLLDSNIDWGQDVSHFQRWLTRHPEVSQIRLASVVPILSPILEGINAEHPSVGSDAKLAHQVGVKSLEIGPHPGWYAVSVCKIHDVQKEYAYFKKFKHITTIGYTIYIYQLDLDEVNKIRSEYSLPALSS